MLHAFEILSSAIVIYTSGVLTTFLVQKIDKCFGETVDQEVKLRLLKRENDKKFADFMEQSESYCRR